MRRRSFAKNVTAADSDVIVVDASVAVEVLLRTSRGEPVISEVVRADRHAPHIIDLEFATLDREVAQVFRTIQKAAQNQQTTQQAKQQASS